MARVVVMGSRATVACIGLRVLRALGVEVPLVISGDEDPGVDDWRLSLARAARQAGYHDGENLLLVRNPHVPAVLDRVRAAEADVILSLQWRRIIRPPLIGLARRGVVNLHNAPLPLLRGCDPFAWAIHDGLETMGVTLHQVIDEGVDSGPILAQRLWPIAPDATAWSLYLDALDHAERLMSDALPDIIAGHTIPQPQQPRYATYHPLGQFRFQDLEVRWDMPATTVSAALRARIFPPFQLPFFRLHRQTIEILACQAAEGRGRPGTVVALNPLVIATRPGAVRIDRLRVNGRELAGAELAPALDLRVGDTA